MPTISPGEVIQVGPVAVRFFMDAGQTGGQFTMFDFRVPAKARVPVPHSHVAFDETIYGLTGVMMWTVGGETIRVEPRQVLFIRRGVIHGFENRGQEDASALSIITPGLLGPAFFQDVADVLNAGGPPDVARIMAVMEKHGLKPAPPA